MKKSNASSSSILAIFGDWKRAPGLVPVKSQPHDHLINVGYFPNCRKHGGILLDDMNKQELHLWRIISWHHPRNLFTYVKAFKDIRTESAYNLHISTIRSRNLGCRFPWISWRPDLTSDEEGNLNPPRIGLISPSRPELSHSMLVIQWLDVKPDVLS